MHRLPLPLNLAIRPLLSLDAHLDGCLAPVLAVVVALAVGAAHASTSLGLFLGQDGQDAEYDGHARVELHAHEALGDGIGNVLKVHGLALDEDPDRDDGVEGAGGGDGGAGEGGEVGG